MRFFDGLMRFVKGYSTNQNDVTEIVLTQKYEEIYTETYINYLSFYSNINRIANAFCKCTVETFFDNKEIKDVEWYTWNVQPNKNQSAYEFKNQLITKLYENNEVLVIEIGDGDLYVADDYTRDEYLKYEDIFKNIKVRDFNLDRTYKQSEVLFFKLNDVDIKRYLDGLTTMMRKLMGIAIKSYTNSKGEKVIIDINDIAKGSETFTKDYAKLLGEDFKNYFENANGVLPLFEGYSINDYSSKPDSNTSTKDIMDLMDKAVETSAIALNVPVSLAKGNVSDTSKVIDELLTFCVDPLVKMIEEEILRKRYGLAEMSKGRYIKINSKSIKHVDIFNIATSIEKLISSACFTINDMRRELGMPRIEEEWADRFFMTKNFSTIEELMKALEGGEMNGKL